LGDEWIERVVLPELQKLVADGSSYTTRVRWRFIPLIFFLHLPLTQVSSLYTASKLLQSRNQAIRATLLPFTVNLLITDKVPNVRMAAIQALIAAKAHLGSSGEVVLTSLCIEVILLQGGCLPKLWTLSVSA
jgi:hypothetical protein